MFKFVYDFELVNPDGSIAEAWTDVNLIPQVGVSHIAGAMFGDSAPIGTFYLGLFANNYVPGSGTTSADLPSNAGEFTAYEQVNRPLWNRVFDGVGSIGNDANRAEFTCTAAATIYGGFLVSVPNKGAATGLLLSIARFDTPRPVVSGQTLRARATLNLIPTEVI